jgi:prolyl oligopeptidase
MRFPQPMNLPAALPLAMLSALASSAVANPLTYPKTAIREVVDHYHGVEVVDPYRWLEDDHADETKEWIAAQNELTQGFLEAIPQRPEIRERLRKLWNFERIGQPSRYGNKWFFHYNSGLQNQPVLKVADDLDGPGRVLLDPNQFSDDGTVSLARFRPSNDGKRLAYAISRSGSDWQEIRIRDVATGEDLPDRLEWVKFSGLSWTNDGSGLFYSRYDAPPEGGALTQTNEFQKLYFHQLGTPQAEDLLVYERRDQPRWGVNGGVTEDGRYLIIHLSDGTEPKNRVYYKDLEVADAPVVELLDTADARYGFVTNDGPIFMFRTDLNAPRYRVIAIDTANPQRDAWRELIPEAPEQLDGVSAVGGQLICEYLKDAKSSVRSYDYAGTLIRELDLPGIGSVGGFGGWRDDQETYYSFTSFTEPGAIFRLDLESGKSTLWRRPEVDFQSDLYETKQVFVTSKDGTKVPMFIVHKKGLELDQPHRTLLYGYGGFNISLTPSFSIGRAVWLERGGVFALVNLRGGGEYGRDWHQAGTRLNKQNVFDDFIASAEWLIAKGYTSSAHLAIQGGSNGGLLVGACMTQRPELFGAALPAVGVMDMLRFHKFTIGWAWEKDYGSAENPEEFAALHAYSPYHRLTPGQRYPATLVTTADHDDRVVPAHSFKFAARLQECQAPGAPPTLIRIESSAGHGAGTALNKMIEKTADEWAFLEAVLGK